MREQYWNRTCRTPGCIGLAKACSDFCAECHKRRKEAFNDILILAQLNEIS